MGKGRNGLVVIFLCGLALAAVALVLLIIGGVLLSVGTARYTKTPTSGTADVDAYNSRVSQFEKSPIPEIISQEWKSSPAHPNTVRFEQQSQEFQAETANVRAFTTHTLGTQDTVSAKNATSFFSRAVIENFLVHNSSTFATTAIFTFNFSTVVKGGVWEVAAPIKKRISDTPIVCTPDLCDRDTEDGSCFKSSETGKVRCDSFAQLSGACKTEGGPNAKYDSRTGSSCFEGDSCGTCSYVGFLSKVCVVIDFHVASSEIVTQTLSQSQKGCRYPFTEQDYSGIEFSASGVQQLQLPIELRSSRDPQITLQQLTKGTKVLAVTEEKPRQGLDLLIAGGCCVAVGAFLAISICAFALANRR